MEQSHEKELPLEEIKKLSNVDLITYLSVNAFEDDEVLELFFRYSKNKTSLDFTETAFLLMDILRSYKAPLVLPTETLTNIFSEFLFTKNKNKIDFKEFKSFFLYFQKKPIENLYKTIQSTFTISHSDFTTHTGIISFFLSTTTTAESDSLSKSSPKLSLKLEPESSDEEKPQNTNSDEDVKELSSPDVTNKPQKENQISLRKIKEKLKESLFEILGRECQIFLFYAALQNRVDAFVVANSEEDLEKIANTVVGDDFEFLNQKVIWSPYKNQQLPRLRVNDYSTIASHVASAMLLGDRMVERAKLFAEEYGVKKKTESTVKNLRSFASELDQNLGLSEKTKPVAEKAKALTRQATIKTQELDKSYGVSQKLNRVSSEISETFDRIKQNPTVQSGMGMVSGMIDSLRQSLSDLTDDTLETLESRRFEERHKKDAQCTSENRAESDSEVLEISMTDPKIVKDESSGKTKKIVSGTGISDLKK